MRKEVIILLWIFTVAFKAEATISVVDHPSIAQDAANEVVNLAKYATTATKQTDTALNTLNQYEQMLLYVARFGNPGALQNIPGVTTVAELYQMYGQLTRDYQQARQLLNPQRYQRDMNYILSSYQNPQWQGWTTSTGVQVPPAQGLYQWATGSWNVANNSIQQLPVLDQQRQRLQQQRDQALKSLQSATTASDVQKYTGVITALNGAIAEVSHAEQELTHRTAMQQSQLKAGQEIFQASQAEQQQAAALSQYDRDIISFQALSGN